jgi:hypothetical protein
MAIRSPVLFDLLVRVDLGFKTAAEQQTFLDDARAAGVPISAFCFSGIRVEGITREEARERLMHLTFSKAFKLFRNAFGSTARFRPRPCEDVAFYWHKARIAVKISGPLWEGIMFSGRFRDPICSPKYMNDTVAMPGGSVTCLQLPYYGIWHHPTSVVLQMREVLIRSGAYPRLEAVS